MDSDVFLTNVPKNAGELAYYVFSIPPRSGMSNYVNELSIYFPRSYNNFAPKTFAYEIGIDLECGLYAISDYDLSFLTYKGLL